MRHRVAGRKFSRHSQHRRWMFRNMLVSLIVHERLKTTLAKAKELRGWADRIVTLGKKNSLHAKRRAFALLRDEGVVKKLFDEIVPRFKGREGGYTRVYRIGWRHGDGAPLSLIEFATGTAPKGEKKKSPVKKAKEVLKKVTSKRRGPVEKEAEKKRGQEKEEVRGKKAKAAKPEVKKETKEKKEKGKGAVAKGEAEKKKKDEA